MAQRVPFIVAELGQMQIRSMLHLYAALAEKERQLAPDRAIGPHPDRGIGSRLGQRVNDWTLPPSMLRMLPVDFRDPSVTKNRIPSAISSG